MKHILLLAIAISLNSYASDNYTKAIDAIELGYDATCETVLTYEPSSKSSDTMYAVKCTKNDKSAKYPYIKLEFPIRSNGDIGMVRYFQCNKIIVTDNFWQKTARCR